MEDQNMTPLQQHMERAGASFAKAAEKLHVAYDRAAENFVKKLSAPRKQGEVNRLGMFGSLEISLSPHTKFQYRRVTTGMTKKDVEPFLDHLGAYLMTGIKSNVLFAAAKAADPKNIRKIGGVKMVNVYAAIEALKQQALGDVNAQIADAEHRGAVQEKAAADAWFNRTGEVYEPGNASEQAITAGWKEARSITKMVIEDLQMKLHYAHRKLLEAKAAQEMGWTHLDQTTAIKIQKILMHRGIQVETGVFGEGLGLLKLSHIVQALDGMLRSSEEEVAELFKQVQAESTRANDLTGEIARVTADAKRFRQQRDDNRRGWAMGNADDRNEIRVLKAARDALVAENEAIMAENTTLKEALRTTTEEARKSARLLRRKVVDKDEG
jgi:hypothetical protein